MPVTLQVSQVRRELYRAAGFGDAAGDGERSTALLGRMFHEAVAGLIGGDDRRNARAALAESEPDLASWQADLRHHAWRHLVGPRLTANQAALHEMGREVLAFWTAVDEACRWLGELLWTIAGDRPGRRRMLPDLGDWLAAEQDLAWEHREPGWSDAVRLVGVADAVLRIPGRSHWCVVELKLGRTAPEADLAQACLYHRMLAASNSPPSHGEGSGRVEGNHSNSPPFQGGGRGRVEGRGDGALAVVGFAPQRQERLFAAAELAAAQERLVELIGRLAGVLPGSRDEGRPARATHRGADAHRAPLAVSPLSSPASRVQVEQGRRLIETFREYGATVEQDGPPIVGPTFLRYPVRLGRGVKLAAVKARAAEVRMRLELEAAPLIDLAEHGQVVIDVQRPDRQFISFAAIRDQLAAGDPLHGSARVPLGVDLDGRLQFADLSRTEHAHVLAAGTTGSGKSEWLRVAVAGLLAANTPDTLRLLLIDPKRNAFHALRESPFLLRPIVYPDERPVSEVLRELAEEMDARYARLDGADTLAQHVAQNGAPLPRIVCVCDEYADLLGRGRDERKALEEQICRLGAKARAAGIHLVLATQQPSRDVVKGALDANIPARVALKMQSAIESRMLLGESGAERLLGMGDLLFKDIGPPRRLQSAWLPPEERDAIFRNEVVAGTGGFAKSE
ncbi:MAG: FtsK/SpoIIIE domain-containing protein [Planctomycetales bacterium]